MSPDLYFALTLIVKMAVTAGFLLVATVTAERAGPLIGGLVATLPISAGPVYIFLALDHDAHFIAQGALGSLVTNALNVLFAVTYALLAQKRSLTVSLGGAFATWLALALATGAVTWTLPLGVVVTLSFTIGAAASGSLAVFPIVLSSIMIILHRRIGGPATAAIMANAVVGLGGFAVAVITLCVTAEQLGSPLALALALAVSVGCNMLIYLVRQRTAA
jgi:hypothetical protein